MIYHPKISLNLTRYSKAWKHCIIGVLAGGPGATPPPQLTILEERKNEKGAPIQSNFQSGWGIDAFGKIQLPPPRKDVFI